MSYTALNDESSLDGSFNAKFNVNLINSEEFKVWLKLFQTKNSTQFNTINTQKCVGRKKIIFKLYLKCIHNVSRGVKGKGKHTGCPCRMTVTILNKSKKPGHREDIELRCIIALSWSHNHSLHSAEVLRHHTVPPEVDEKLIHLLRHGHTIKSALKCIEMDIDESVGDDPAAIEHLRASRSVLPDNRHAFYIFKKQFKKEYGDPHNDEGLEKFIANINESFGETCVVHEDLKGLPLVAICTPFMKRVHKHIQESGEIVFVDSSGGMDKNKYRVFIFTMRSKAGALPIAVGITPSESVEHLTRLFNLIKSVIPPAESFYNRKSVIGPMLFMTDDNAAEQSALYNVWPQSRHMLCRFHILQAQWRYLLATEHGVEQRCRPALFAWAKKLLYSPTEIELDVQLQWFLSDPMVLENEKFRDQMIGLYVRRDKWCRTTRVGELLRANHTNDYVEASMHVLKDQIFDRTRTFNMVQMVDFLTERFSSYYERRLNDFATNRPYRPAVKYSKYDGEIISEVSEDLYEITETRLNVTYVVNTATTICTCPEGETGKMCKHLYYVFTLRKTNAFVNNYDVNDCRELMYLVATGNVASVGWLDNLPEVSADGIPRAEVNGETALDNNAHGGSGDGVQHANDQEDSVGENDEPSDAAPVSLKDNVSKIDAFTNLLKVKCPKKLTQELSGALDQAIATLKNIKTANELVSAITTFAMYKKNTSKDNGQITQDSARSCSRPGQQI